MPCFWDKTMKLRSKKAQAVLMEYVIIAMIAMAAVVTMIIYVQRGLQGRIQGARTHMLKEVAAAVPGERVQIEYEPYYTNTLTDIDQDAWTKESMISTGILGPYEKESLTSGSYNSVSTQLPPKDFGITE